MLSSITPVRSRSRTLSTGGDGIDRARPPVELRAASPQHADDLAVDHDGAARVTGLDVGVELEPRPAGLALDVDVLGLDANRTPHGDGHRRDTAVAEHGKTPRSPRSTSRRRRQRSEVTVDADVGEVHVGIERDHRCRRSAGAVGDLDLVGPFTTCAVSTRPAPRRCRCHAPHRSRTL